MLSTLVTGSAGFIGYHICQRLLRDGARVVGLDNLNDYYSVALKEARNARLLAHPRYEFHLRDLQDKDLVRGLLVREGFDTVFHMAAQAGVRYSLEAPEAYLKSNIDGTLSLLEAARFAPNKPHLLMASSSSVYGASDRYPYREDDPADRPLALYGATKRANELMGHAYAHLFGLRVTMLRFFTVYGPWGRPDMALFRFVKAIREGREIELYNNGDMVRDFTYVDDIVDGVLALDAARKREGQPLYDVFNIGASQPRPLRDFLEAIEASVGEKARVKPMPFQSGDVYKTHADVGKLRALCGYEPRTGIREGVARFVEWYVSFYGAGAA
ncbi:MAG TPA: NAD-dependent epimerase/dehydratase family protein [Vicinamibacteria bacterium]|nr:NAD-dependent epimerase/dehydratase family protein [Vicinamibacteria bacterium]